MKRVVAVLVDGSRHELLAESIDAIETVSVGGQAFIETAAVPGRQRTPTGPSTSGKLRPRIALAHVAELFETVRW